MNDKELEELNRNVQCAGICREKYIRCALMGITIHPRAPDSCKELARQVAAVGNNLNQLARIKRQGKSKAALHKIIPVSLPQRQIFPRLCGSCRWKV